MGNNMKHTLKSQKKSFLHFKFGKVIDTHLNPETGFDEDIVKYDCKIEIDLNDKKQSIKCKDLENNKIYEFKTLGTFGNWFRMVR